MKWFEEGCFELAPFIGHLIPDCFNRLPMYFSMTSIKINFAKKVLEEEFIEDNFNDKLILEKIICIYEDMKSEGNGTQMGNLGNYKLLTFFACIPIINLR